MVKLALGWVCDTSGLLFRGNRRRVGEMYRGEFGGTTSPYLVVKAPLIRHGMLLPHTTLVDSCP